MMPKSLCHAARGEIQWHQMNGPKAKQRKNSQLCASAPSKLLCACLLCASCQRNGPMQVGLRGRELAQSKCLCASARRKLLCASPHVALRGFPAKAAGTSGPRALVMAFVLQSCNFPVGPQRPNPCDCAITRAAVQTTRQLPRTSSQEAKAKKFAQDPARAIRDEQKSQKVLSFCTSIAEGWSAERKTIKSPQFVDIDHAGLVRGSPKSCAQMSLGKLLCASWSVQSGSAQMALRKLRLPLGLCFGGIPNYGCSSAVSEKWGQPAGSTCLSHCLHNFLLASLRAGCSMCCPWNTTDSSPGQRA